MRVVKDPAISSAPPSEAEVAVALNKLKNGEVPGNCNITPEILNAGGYSAVQWLTNYSKQSEMEAPFLRIGKRVSILPFYKGLKVAAMTARNIVVSLCCLARASCLHVLLAEL